MNNRFIIMALTFTCFCLCLTFSVNAQTAALTAEDYFKQALESSGKSDWDSAIANYTKAIELNPNATGAYYNRGRIYSWHKNNYDQAIKDFTKVIELSPDDGTADQVILDAYRQRAAAYKYADKFELANKDYSKVIELDPNRPLSYSERGFFYEHSMGNYDLAIKDYTSALKLEPESPDYAALYHWRGDLYKKKGNYDLAIQDYTKFIALNPFEDPITGYSDRAQAYSGKGNYALALEDWNKVIESAPDEPYYYEQRAELYRKMGKTDLAKADSRKAAKLRKSRGY